MEPIRRRPQDITPGRPAPVRSAAPSGHRPMFSDFTVRSHARPAMNKPAQLTTRPVPSAPLLSPRPVEQVPAPQASTHQQPARPMSQPSPTPIQQLDAPQPTTVQQTQPAQSAHPMPSQMPITASQPSVARPQTPTTPAHQQPSRPFATTSKTQPHSSRTSRAGLVGFVCFVVLAGLLLSPFLPAKTFDSFPGSSQSSSSGDDSLACIHQLGQTDTTLTYDHKLGSPITYSYATTTTQKATCDNKLQSAVAGHTGQFNPLGLAIDISLALIVAVVVSKIWRRLFGEQN